MFKNFNLILPLEKYKIYGKFTPAFLFEKKILILRAKEYLNAARDRKIKIEPFYAVKSNDYLGLLKEMVKLGFGLDCSSKRELKLAKIVGARNVLFTGPGKKDEELKFAIENFKEIIINVDSFDELERIRKINLRKEIKIGVRISTLFQKEWRRFGILLKDLKKFFIKTKNIKNLKFSGIQFHKSWNKNSKPYLDTLNEIKKYLVENFSKSDLEKIEFVDIGGGLEENEDIFRFFREIKNFWRKNLLKILPRAKIFTEPGRWLSAHCFHILLKVSEIKNGKIAILDGGTDNFGFSSKYYSPIINVSHPAKKERKFILAGNLCSVLDIFGKKIFASKVERGDIILIPFQGAYTFSLATDFIKEIPKVIEI
jgi:diaminopimelate decarboxylase